MIRRDRTVEDALNRLDVPEHEPGFFAELEEKLAVIDEGRDPRHVGNVAPLDGSRAPRCSIMSRPRTLAGFAVAAAAMLVVMAGLGDLLWRGPGEPVGPKTASAAEITAKAAAAFEQAEALRGTLVLVEALKDSEGVRRDVTTWSFATTSRGDFRLSGRVRSADASAAAREERAFDASKRIEMGYSADPDSAGPPVAWRRTRLAAGAPDQAASDLFHRQLGGLVRALVAAKDPAVRETTYEGRSAWELAADVEPNLLAEGSPDRFEITVDRATGFPVRVVETASGELVREVRLQDLEVDPVLPPKTFTLQFPKGAEVYDHDLAFDVVEVEDAAQVVGYTPVLPTWLPEGYALADVTVAHDADPTGKEGGNPRSEDVVSVAYRRGFDVLVVSTRRVGPEPSAWSDPLSLGEGYIDRPDRLTLAAGAFKGGNAELMLDPRGLPHLWTMNDDLVLTVAGDLTRAELVRVAESLATAE